mgnify:CR=1 FL=1
MTNKELLEETRRAIAEVFGEFVRTEDINESICPTKDHPGGWAPGSHVVISTENGLPTDAYEPFLAEKWMEVTDRLPDGYFIQTINPAIMAVYDI